MAGVVVCGMVGTMAAKQLMPTGEPSIGLDEKAEQAQRSVVNLGQALLDGEIDFETFRRRLEETGVHPGFLVVGSLQVAAGLAGAVGLLVLGVVHVLGMRVRPRGNWAPGIPWQPIDAIEAILFFGCAQLMLGLVLAPLPLLIARVVPGRSAPAMGELRPEYIAIPYVLASIATIALLAYRTPGGLPRLWHAMRARLRPVWLRSLQGVGGYMLALPLVAGANLANPFGKEDLSADPLMSMLMGSQSIVGWIILFTVIGLCAPVFEELLFRGCAYPAFRRRLGAPLAVVANGVLFGAIHGQLAMLLPLVVLGMVFALLYEFSGSILPSIIAHSAQNTLTLLTVMWLSQ
jgi:membrane protease YdiL (CAAX protease family)